MPDKTLQEWLAWLETLSPREIVLGLDRVAEVIDRLALGRPSYVCNIAGTNGKGSSAAMLEAILQAAGERTGCYTSPHLRRYNERIRVAGEACSDAEIVAAFKCVEAVRGDLPLTYFEFGTLAALVVFDQREVTASILEVGMGGRLDAVNAIDPDGSIITNVGLDHCAWLGDDVESIAAEKAGIMRNGKPVIFGSEQVPASIEAAARERCADLRLPGRDYRFSMGEGNTWSWFGTGSSLEALRRPAPAAAIQVQNAAAVLALLEASGKPDWLDFHDVDRALSSLQLPGRMQKLKCGHEWLLDVAHNAEAAAQLAGFLSAHHANRKITAIFTALADKNIAGIVAPLCPRVDRWIAVSSNANRAIPARDIAREVANTCGKPCRVAGNLQEALDASETVTEADDLILVTGSFYVVGPALDELYSRRMGD